MSIWNRTTRVARATTEQSLALTRSLIPPNRGYQGNHTRRPSHSRRHHEDEDNKEVDLHQEDLGEDHEHIFMKAVVAAADATDANAL